MKTKKVPITNIGFILSVFFKMGQMRFLLYAPSGALLNTSRLYNIMAKEVPIKNSLYEYTSRHFFKSRLRWFLLKPVKLIPSAYNKEGS